MNRKDYIDALKRIQASDSAKERAIKQMALAADHPAPRRKFLAMLPAYGMAALALTLTFVIIFKPGAQQPVDVTPTPTSDITPTPTATSTPAPSPTPALSDQYKVLETLTCDLNGDGKQESLFMRGDNQVLQALFAVCDDGDLSFNMEVQLQPLEEYTSQVYRKARVLDMDGDGGDEIVVYVDKARYESETWGSTHIITLSYKEGTLSQYECNYESGYVPVLNTLLEYEAETCSVESPYGGGMRWNAERGTAEIAQYVFHGISENGVGFLVTEMKFGKNGYETVSQRIEGLEYATAPGNDLIVLEETVCDINGDGNKETVRIKTPRPWGEYRNDLYAECTEDDLYFMENINAPYLHFVPMLVSDLDGDGGDELLIRIPTGGSGGDMTVVTLTMKDGIILQYFFAQEDGFTATGNLIDNYQAELRVKESGLTHTFPLYPESLPSPEFEQTYDENGKLLGNSEMQMDGILEGCISIDENGIVTIVQAVWFYTHPNTAGCLVTELRLGKGGYEIVKQSVEGPEFDDERFMARAAFDFDGDGKDEDVILRRRWDNEFYLELYCVRGYDSFNAEIGTYDFVPYHLADQISADINGDGFEELILLIDTNGVGGYGRYVLEIITVVDRLIVHYPVPGDGWGYSATGKLMPEYTAEITVEETGFSETLSILESDFPQEDRDQYFNADGTPKGEQTNLFEMGPIYQVKYLTERQTIEIRQGMYFGYPNVIADFVTELRIDSDGYVAVSQHLERIG